MKDKKDYRDILKVLGFTGSYPIILNKLNDVAVVSNDPQLREKAKDIILAIQKLLGPMITIGNLKNSLQALAVQWKDDKGQRQRDVAQAVFAAREYAQSCLDSIIPGWQILALQHRWTPPSFE